MSSNDNFQSQKNPKDECPIATAQVATVTVKIKKNQADNCKIE